MEQTLQQVDQPLEDRTKLSFNMALALSLSICRLLNSINSKQDLLSFSHKNIYQQGGRTFWVHYTGPFGCLPVNMFYMGTPAPGYLDSSGCVKAQNEKAMEFNRKLKETVINLRTELTRAAITYVDVYAAKYEMMSNPKRLGFANPLKVCCGYHEKYDHIWCGNRGKVNNTEMYGGSCTNPATAVSWDGVHYTEAANKHVADRTLGGVLTDPPVPITRACYRQ